MGVSTPISLRGVVSRASSSDTKFDANAQYEAGDIAWMLCSTALVLLMIPGVSFFYSGLSRRKSALSLLFLPLLATAITAVQWFVMGYSLTFSHDGGKFLGNLRNVGFRNVLAEPSVASTHTPDLLFAIYQMMFACITTAIAVGGVAERGRVLPCLVFCFLWTTLVYDPVASWTWNPSGWVYKLGGLDFAGGTPVHITSGSAALAYSLFLGKRRGHGTMELNFRPHNVTLIVLGTTFLWVGWFGFNAGSALAANLRAVMAAVVTFIAASTGGITWCFMDYRIDRKFSAVGFCSGIVAGLVVITPASGYVTPWAAVVFGVVAGVGCNYATKLKLLLSVDDALDIFAIHGVGGFIGDLLTGLFAADYVASLDGTTQIPGGWLNKNWIQLAIQCGDGVTGMVYSFCLSSMILFVINYVPGLHLRISDKDEILGHDACDIGEFAYDYVQLERDVRIEALPSITLNRDMEIESADVHFKSDDSGVSFYEMKPSSSGM